MNKLILDATCGGRTIWLESNKHHPRVLYIDVRQEERGYGKSRHHREGYNFEIKPDELQDFRNLPYMDKSFKLVVWDPPHIIQKNGQERLTGILTKKYGALNAETWQSDLKQGFLELWRVLDDYGVLVFKFSDRCVKFEQVLSLFPEQPLFGTTTAKRNDISNRWFTFIKIPNEER